MTTLISSKRDTKKKIVYTCKMKLYNDKRSIHLGNIIIKLYTPKKRFKKHINQFYTTKKRNRKFNRNIWRSQCPTLNYS